MAGGGSPAPATARRGSFAPGAVGGGQGTRARGAPRRSVARAVGQARERRRRRLVRTYRGCIDALPAAQRSALVIRYGIGEVRPRSRREAAGLLGLSRTRLGRIERSALRALVSEARRSSCERTGVALGTLVAVYGVLAERSFLGGLTTAATSGEAGLDLMSSLAAAGQGEGGVAGARESGSDQDGSEDSGEEGEERPTPAGAPLLGTPFGEVAASPTNPLFIALVAVVLAGAAWVGRGLMRAVR